ncbi:TetR/AcrR family transcriptional regulator [Pseudonocardia sp. CA-142604]|uniref:TetR/AcrR family transcriptional regulator n=1 Tax=Pseudonocardia sp. CA-142604 TaxID=3240024 RepID=UPI003D9033D1
MTVDSRSEKTRPDRAAATRDRILDAAERLFAERGVLAVSNRQIGEAAGQGNNSVVGYHFGGRSELVLAILRRHAVAVEKLRTDLLTRVGPGSALHDWVGCIVRPLPAHLAELGDQSWHARFLAQASNEPTLRAVIRADAKASLSLRQAREGMFRLLPALPAEVRAERGEMSRLVVVHMCAEYERALQNGAASPNRTWEMAAARLVDAVVGLWLAPVTPAVLEPDAAQRWRQLSG